MIRHESVVSEPIVSNSAMAIDLHLKGFDLYLPEENNCAT